MRKGLDGVPRGPRLRSAPLRRQSATCSPWPPSPTAPRDPVPARWAMACAGFAISRSFSGKTRGSGHRVSAARRLAQPSVWSVSLRRAHLHKLSPAETQGRIVKGNLRDKTSHRDDLSRRICRASGGPTAGRTVAWSWTEPSAPRSTSQDGRAQPSPPVRRRRRVTWGADRSFGLGPAASCEAVTGIAQEPPARSGSSAPCPTWQSFRSGVAETLGPTPTPGS